MFLHLIIDKLKVGTRVRYDQNRILQNSHPIKNLLSPLHCTTLYIIVKYVNECNQQQTRKPKHRPCPELFQFRLHALREVLRCHPQLSGTDTTGQRDAFHRLKTKATTEHFVLRLHPNHLTPCYHR